MLTKRKILVVEDYKFWFDYLKLEVDRKKLPLHLSWAHHREEALEILSQDNLYDAILMNIEMPVMDGVSATYEIRKRDLNLPIIAWTRHCSYYMGNTCRKAGMNAFIERDGSTLIHDVMRELHNCGVFGEENTTSNDTNASL